MNFHSSYQKWLQGVISLFSSHMLALNFVMSKDFHIAYLQPLNTQPFNYFCFFLGCTEMIFTDSKGSGIIFWRIKTGRETLEIKASWIWERIYHINNFLNSACAGASVISCFCHFYATLWASDEHFWVLSLVDVFQIRPCLSLQLPMWNYYSRFHQAYESLIPKQLPQVS